MTGTRTPVARAPGFAWPRDVVRVPDEDWVTRPLDEFGVRYNQVGGHAYYQKNLDPLVAQAAVAIRDGQLLVDYSAGTGLLTRRVLDATPARIGVLNVDPSPKFLRVAVENHADDERVAFRLLRQRKEEKRLETLDDVLDPALAGRVDVVTAANAIHLYPDLHSTLTSWHRVLRPGGIVLINSGCLRNPHARRADWVLDDTVDRVNEIVVELVLREPAFARYRENVVDRDRWSAYLAARQKAFVPLRPLDAYTDALSLAGFDVLNVSDATIFVDVAQFAELLVTYHESVLGWVGGTARIAGVGPSEQALRDRFFLIRYGLERTFPTADEFPCNWTYLTRRRKG
ncbi:hypothetical protein DMP23_20590 [Amycolatopsis sp. A1MSW2902]|uniref:class I SAM-dependent methyltransferase n=1 Tax=Amycolatopsis sp. A1MSW2902 TaxID=687413 RepID=UPI00307EF2F1